MRHTQAYRIKIASIRTDIPIAMNQAEGSIESDCITLKSSAFSAGLWIGMCIQNTRRGTTAFYTMRSFYLYFMQKMRSTFITIHLRRYASRTFENLVGTPR
jgi:hypothetical protein